MRKLFISLWLWNWKFENCLSYRHVQWESLLHPSKQHKCPSLSACLSRSYLQLTKGILYTVQPELKWCNALNNESNAWCFHRAEITCFIPSSCSSSLLKLRSLACWGEWRCAIRMILVSVSQATVISALDLVLCKIMIIMYSNYTLYIILMWVFSLFMVTGEWILAYQGWTYFGSLETEIGMLKHGKTRAIWISLHWTVCLATWMHIQMKHRKCF